MGLHVSTAIYTLLGYSEIVESYRDPRICAVVSRPRLHSLISTTHLPPRLPRKHDRKSPRVACDYTHLRHPLFHLANAAVP